MNKYLRKLSPAGHTLLVKLKPDFVDNKYEKTAAGYEEKTSSGLILSIKKDNDVARERFSTQEAYVLAIGPTSYKGVDDSTPWVKVGDCVLIKKYSGEDREDIIDGEICRLINDIDVTGIFEGEVDPCLK